MMVNVQYAENSINTVGLPGGPGHVESLGIGNQIYFWGGVSSKGRVEDVH
jgi:hypothetical protein